MKYKVKFYWWASYKIWDVFVGNGENVTDVCDRLCQKYKTIHYEVLEG